ncbi:hypothetical protein H8S95_09780 [Pontibacter sp. KCTC 32443]|uniref:hypothetical protein n=1 Tax=Pontibacter TaxID=323449 RepID=UPI00164DE22E|nr:MULTISPECIES: hypothetical protein [Pontibacter]MBC5774349.1 hypothetical protein [Pontibacter sp. KCTC 32443]
MSKIFLCKWGAWDEHAMNSYEPKTEEVSEDFFSDDNGYDPEEIEAIAVLEVGEQFDVTYGNHTVTRTR